MIIEPTPLEGAKLVVTVSSVDERGSFTPLYDRAVFREHGLETEWETEALSSNRRRGTIRGLHYQSEPWAEAKLVRCTRGRVFDVVVDTRPASPEFGRWFSRELIAGEPGSIYLAPGMAHGFQTLTDDSEILYLLSAPYVASHATGVAWDSKRLAISWPEPVTCISDRDRGLPQF